MISSINAKNFTVFNDAKLSCGKGLNVIVGENGAGKTHLLKLAYSVLAISAEEGRKPNAGSPTKSSLQAKLGAKLVNVFRPESLGRLARRKQGRSRSEVSIKFRDKKLNLSFTLGTQSKDEVQIDELPSAWSDVAPAYLPTRELLTIYPGFISIYENHYLEFEETWRDTCLLLGAPIKRGAREARVQELLRPLEEAMGGSIELDRNGRFYLVTDRGRMEMPLVAEGLRKLAMIARLVATGALLDKGCLFWDEPEANLNPRIIKSVAKTIVELSKNGIQVFLATHSLFLLRELEILQRGAGIDTRYFGLHLTSDGVEVKQGSEVADIGSIALLEEELEQSDRFMENEANS